MMPAIDLRLGDYRDVLRDVESVDCLIADPPYSERTHAGQRHGRRDERRANGYVSARGIGYAAWSAEDATAFVDFWAPRVSGWFCVFSDHALASAYEQALVKHGRTWFAPIACVQIGMNVRLAGDGPSNWTTWLTVARPKALAKWGTLPGAYVGKPWEDGQNSATAGRRSGVVGSKPVWLMRALVRDYSRPGDLVVDPCAGGATTLIASQLEGRRSIGAEMDPDTFAKAERRIKYGSHAVADNGQERLW